MMLTDLMLARPRSPHWRALHDAHLKIQPFCMVCGCRTGLNVHHIKDFHEHPELELDPANLFTLGEQCPTGHHHLIVGHFGDFKDINPDVVSLARIMYLHYATTVKQLHEDDDEVRRVMQEWDSVRTDKEVIKTFR